MRIYPRSFSNRTAKTLGNLAGRPAINPIKTPLVFWAKARKTASAPLTDVEKWLPREQVFPKVEGVEKHPISLPAPLHLSGPFKLQTFQVEVKRINPQEFRNPFQNRFGGKPDILTTVDRNTFLFSFFDAVIIDFRVRFAPILNLYLQAIAEVPGPQKAAAERYFEIAVGQFYEACTTTNPALDINRILKAWYREQRQIPILRTDFFFPHPNLLELFSNHAVLTDSEKVFIGEHLAYIRQGLDQEVIGQEAAKKSILDPFLLAVRGIEANRKGRPIRVLMWLGGSGVGKSSLAKAAALHMFGTEDALHTLRGPEIAEDHQITKLTGATATWVGYGDDIGFFEWYHRNNGTGILLVDEFSAACNAFIDLFITMAGEDGVLENGPGTQQAFTKNLIIILADNLGNSAIESAANPITFKHTLNQQGVFEIPEETRRSLIEDRLHSFPTQFRTRIDETVIFHPLTPDIQQAIVKRALETGLEELRERIVFRVRVSNTVLPFLVAQSFDRVGTTDSEIAARDLKRTIDEHIIAELLKMDLRNEVPAGGVVTISLKNKNLSPSLNFTVSAGSNEGTGEIPKVNDRPDTRIG